MGNRKQPFGYRVVMGEIALHPQESKLVEYIFGPVDKSPKSSTLMV